ncbi:MAG: hypothetical protein KDC44_16110 [Phaeodactylibacter sp.]|nr:hypothetical protein [Phaeodactylibacter sp.]
MKLRCTHNSIRIRLRKSELELLRSTGMVRETISFPGGTVFSFELNINAQSSEVVADIHNGELDVCLPVEMANQWIDTDQVGIEVEQLLPDGQQLHLLIEKDFPCQHRPEEDKSDTFIELAEEAQKTDC